MAQIASSSSPSTSYQVFLNHRGPDVKTTFASNLYRRLTSFGLRVFLDKPELEEGRTFPSQIEAAIQSASIHIAIFSPTYAQSVWCLNELIHMIKSGATILPVFYNVEPRELRWTGKDGRGRYAEALRIHEQKERNIPETIQKWREALCTAADISGFELEAFHGDEGKLLEAVVQRVLNNVDKTPLKFVAEHPTGLKEKLEEFETKVLRQQQKGNVVGIVGQGGVGKTTLAKEFFSERRWHYSRSCFLYDVRENYASGSLHMLQRKLLKDLTGLDRPIYNINEGIEELLKHLSSSYNFLIILDDVDDARQLQPFLPIKDILSPSSLILITSRDKEIFKIAKITETSVYELKGLDLQHSEELFCHHAFHQPHPLPEFADLVHAFLISCDGLPLSLKVFGALLWGEDDRSYWQEKLNALKNILPIEIHERLKISYDSLSSKDQEIFLDIVCFFLGQDADTVIRIRGQLKDLANKCLLEVGSKNEIKMHDHIREMGRSIAENVSPRRLWRQTPNNIDDLLERSSCGNIEVRGIMMDGPLNFNEENTRLLMSEVSWYRRWSPELLFGNYLRSLLDNFRFCGILNLQLVSAESDYLEQILRRVGAPQLQWIRWYKCTHSSLPSWIPMENLKVLEVEGKNLRVLWEAESQVPRQLRQLNICAPLRRVPKSIMHLKHLEKIDICHALFKTLPEELCDVQSLKYLMLRNCTEMISLPDSLGNLTNLQQIGLTNASRLQMLPGSFGNLIGLEYLFLRGCPKLRGLPDSFGLLTQLRHLCICNCPALKCLPQMLPGSFGNLIGLKYLFLGGCPKLRGLPDSFGLLTQLEDLTIKDCPELKCLPDSFGLLTQLRHLWISPEMISLPDSLGNLTNLQKIDLRKASRLQMLPGSFGNLIGLKYLFLEDCPKLRGLPDSFGLLTQLEDLTIKDCPELKYLPDSFGLLTQLRNLWISHCPALKCLPDSFRLLSRLLRLTIGHCGIEYLPPKMNNLQFLEILKCPLREFPFEMNNLEVLRIAECPLREFPFRRVEGETETELNTLDKCRFHGGICPNLQGVFPNLQSILLGRCMKLRKIGEFCGLPKLKGLNICDCENIEEISSVETLMSLERWYVSGSAKIETMERLAQLTKLETVTISGTIIGRCGT